MTTDGNVNNLPQFNFDNTFARELEGFFKFCSAERANAPKMIQFNHALAKELRLDSVNLDSENGLEIFSGNKTAEGSQPLAQAYAGHQFGGFSPQLGDGRALLLGEVIDAQQHRRDIQLKGSGRTPFSRGGDGKAAVGPVLREYLIGEGMYALGIPTTRALAAVATGDHIYREIPLPGAVLTRVAASHIRVGTFQYAAARGDINKIRTLADYSIQRHYPETAKAENPYLAFFAAVTNAQAALVARWMNIGFIHGVMNTDNMTISGETIDYGPCAFMDRYAAGTVFSSIDQHGRYAYENQPKILIWNLARLAETLIPIVDPDKKRAIGLLKDLIERIQPIYESYWLNGMRAKIGLSCEESSDLKLINDLLSIMEKGNADFTLTFRHLSKGLRGDNKVVKQLFNEPNDLDDWGKRWKKRLEREGVDQEAIAQAMDRVNPIYIPRNHKVEEALAAAGNQGNIEPFSKLLIVIGQPFKEVSGNKPYAVPDPITDRNYRTFCGT